MRLRQIGAAVGWSILARLGFAVWGLWLGTSVTQGEEPARKAGTPTFTKDVAAILQKRCQGCHRRGEIGPFGLETYEQVRKRSLDIAAVALDRSMPPWKPTSGVGPNSCTTVR